MAEQEKQHGDDCRENHIVEMWTPLQLHIDNNYAFIKFSIIFRLLSFMATFLFYILFTVFNILFYRLRFEGKENIKKLRRKGFISVANHCHFLDTVFIAQKFFPRTVYFPTVQRNFQVPFLKTLLRLLRSFPIPERTTGFKMILPALGEALKRNKIVHFFPEGDLWHLHQGIDDRFKRGAFYLAHIYNVPVLPMVLKFKPMKLFGKNIGKNWITVKLYIDKPVYPGEPAASLKNVGKKSLNRMIAEVHSRMDAIMKEK